MLCYVLLGLSSKATVSLSSTRDLQAQASFASNMAASNTCPGHVFFTLDVRHPSTEALSTLCAEIHSAANRIASEESEKGCSLEWTENFRQSNHHVPP